LEQVIQKIHMEQAPFFSARFEHEMGSDTTETTVMKTSLSAESIISLDLEQLQERKRGWFLEMMSRFSSYVDQHQLFHRNLFAIRLGNVEFAVDAAMLYGLSRYFMENVHETIREILRPLPIQALIKEELVKRRRVSLAKLQLELEKREVVLEKGIAHVAVQVGEISPPLVTPYYPQKTELIDALNQMMALLRMAEEDALICEDLRHSKISPMIRLKPNSMFFFDKSFAIR
jgi:hypothetical protein